MERQGIPSAECPEAASGERDVQPQPTMTSEVAALSAFPTLGISLAGAPIVNGEDETMAGWRRASAALRLTGRTDFRQGGPWSRRTHHSDNKTESLTRATDREN